MSPTVCWFLPVLVPKWRSTSVSLVRFVIKCKVWQGELGCLGSLLRRCETFPRRQTGLGEREPISHCLPWAILQPVTWAEPDTFGACFYLVIAVKYLLKKGGGQLEKVKQHQPSRWLRHTRSVFLAGILAAVPLGVTYLVFRWLFLELDSVFQPAIIFFIGRSLPGVGLVAVVLLVYLLGLIMTNVVGRRLIRGFDSMMCRAPIIQYVYAAAR